MDIYIAQQNNCLLDILLNINMDIYIAQQNNCLLDNLIVYA